MADFAWFGFKRLWAAHVRCARQGARRSSFAFTWSREDADEPVGEGAEPQFPP